MAPFPGPSCLAGDAWDYQQDQENKQNNARFHTDHLGFRAPADAEAWARCVTRTNTAGVLLPSLDLPIGALLQKCVDEG
jgi:hypothetical protein